MSAWGSVYSWCGCRDPETGRRLGSRCPQRGKPGHGSWYLSLELPAGLDGHRRRIRRGGFPTRKAAEKALVRVRMPEAAEAVLTTGEWLDRWLEQRTGPRESTMRGYAAHVRLYLRPCLGHILLADLTAQHVQAMFTAIGRHYEAEGRPVTAATLARIRATLRAALNAAVRVGLITVNAASLAELPYDLRHGAATLALAAGADLKVVQDMLGHSSIVLTADTYTSVLPEVAHKAAEDVATLIIQAGCLVPGTARPRQPEPPGHGGGGQGSGSRAHPGRQVSRPARADLDINRNRLSGNVPAQRRNAHMLLQMGSGHPAIPRPTSAHTDTLTREKIGVKPRVSTGDVFT